MKVDKTVINQYLGNVVNDSVTILDTVTEIGTSAFKNSKIQSVTFESNPSLKIIRSSAFEGCTYLETFILPETIENINDFAFSGCINLKSIIKFSSKLISISQETFYNCKSITEVEFDETENEISLKYDSIFEQCTDLHSVKFSNKITSIGSSIFKNCTSLKTITLPETITYIGIDAFSNSGLEEVTFVSNVNNLRTLSSSRIVKIDQSAFCDAEHLKNITFPTSIEIIDVKAFSNTGFIEIEIPSSITEIHEYAFSDCKLLQKFTFEENSQLRQLGLYVFQNCPKLETVYIENSHFITEIGALLNIERTHLYFFPPASKIKYFTFPQGVKNMDPAAFYGCSNIVNILFPDDSLEAISIDGFSGCTHLKFINFPKSIRDVGKDAFQGCIELKCGLEIEDNNNEIREQLINSGISRNAFKSCLITCKSKKTQIPKPTMFMIAILSKSIIIE